MRTSSFPIPSLNFLQILLGFGLALVISLLAYRLKSLSRSGVVAATCLGTVIFGLGGLPWAIVLLGFFLTASAFSRFARGRKIALGEKYAKDDRRDAMQVLANGGIAGLAVVFQVFWPQAHWPWLIGAAALAAANADTWATELGVLARQTPRLILNGREVERGTAGGVTLAGTLAALAGATWIGLLAVLFWPVVGTEGGMEVTFARLALIALAGFIGSLVDSLLGASVQAMYFCPQCQKETERHPFHLCGAPTRQVRGWPWMNNDWVNAFCTASAALVAVLVGWMLAAPLRLVPVTEVKPMAKPVGPVLYSPAFAQGERIPKRHTCDGEDLSPALYWENVGEDVRSFALIMEDPDAPMGTFIHWVLYNIPAERRDLPEGVPTQVQVAQIGTQGRNDFRRIGYGGPCPPPGKPHRYRFILYGLSRSPDLPEGLDAKGLRRAMEPFILFQTTLEGLYGR